MTACAEITSLTADLSESVGSVGTIVSEGPYPDGKGLVLTSTPLDECWGSILLTADDYLALMPEPIIGGNMSTCAQLINLVADLSGSVGSVGPVTGGQGLLLTSTPLSECTGLILLSSDDYTKLMSGPALMEIFKVPVAGDLQQMWMLGFGLPVIAYLAAWGYGVVINWFNEHPR